MLKTCEKIDRIWKWMGSWQGELEYECVWETITGKGNYQENFFKQYFLCNLSSLDEKLRWSDYHDYYWDSFSSLIYI